MLAVPTTPAAKLSSPTTKPKRVRSFSKIATEEKDKFVSMTRKAPIIRVVFTPTFFTRSPPKKNPIIEATTATILTM